MTVAKSIQSLKIETKRKSIQTTMIQRETEIQNPLELSTEERLQNEINILSESTSKALDYSWEVIAFFQNKNDTLRERIKEFEVNNLNIDMRNLERGSEIRNRTRQRTEMLIKEKYPSENTMMTSELSEVYDDSSFEGVPNLNERERELHNEIIQLKISTGNALDCNWDILKFAQFENKKLNEKLNELGSSMGSSNVL